MTGALLDLTQALAALISGKKKIVIRNTIYHNGAIEKQEISVEYAK